MTASARAQRDDARSEWDGKERIYLCVEGLLGDRDVIAKLKQHPDDDPNSETVTIRKVDAIRLDRLNETHIVIPVVRDINANCKRKGLRPSEVVGGAPMVETWEEPGPVIECNPVAVADFYKRARGRDAEPHFDRDGFISAVGAVCMPAAPRTSWRAASALVGPGGKRQEHEYLVLRWG